MMMKKNDTSAIMEIGKCGCGIVFSLHDESH